MATTDSERSDIALMIDAETLALGPSAHVTQVGLCAANLKTRQYVLKPTNYWLSAGEQIGRVIDVDTVRWWMKQDRNVAAGVFEAPEGYERVTPAWLCAHIKELLHTHPGMTVWGSPAMFDLPLLTSLFGCKPWKYNYERDMMTLYKYLDPEGKLQPPNNDKAHDAAADAHWQMEYLFKLMAKLEALEHNSRPDAVTRVAVPA